MSKIIFLNGCGSSGKTSIAKSIGYLSSETWITFGIDTFIDMIPPSKQEKYFKFIPGQNEYGPTMRVEPQLESQKIFELMPKFAEMIASNQNNIIIDEVLFDYKSIQSYAETLKNHNVYYIGIFCERKTMQEREILRGDRCIGPSNDQFDRIYGMKDMASVVLSSDQNIINSMDDENHGNHGNRENNINEINKIYTTNPVNIINQKIVNINNTNNMNNANTLTNYICSTNGTDLVNDMKEMNLKNKENEVDNLNQMKETMNENYCINTSKEYIDKNLIREKYSSVLTTSHNFYDVIVDTTNISSFEAARIILDYIIKTPNSLL
jgi:chloramphenicol 3-O phosphotransferase